MCEASRAMLIKNVGPWLDGTRGRTEADLTALSCTGRPLVNSTYVSPQLSTIVDLTASYTY
jgi:hypothetical protein